MRQPWIGRFMLAAMLAGGTMMASDVKPNGPLNGDEITAKIIHQIRMYPYYSIWDNINVQVREGQVELLGQVSQPFKKADLGRLLQHVPGVTGVNNELQVLPLSPFDDRLRVQVARAVYGDPTLSRYAMGALPSIHVIVDNGHVTLEGVVNNDMEKQVAGMRASAAGLSLGQVTNNLRVENPRPHKS